MKYKLTLLLVLPILFIFGCKQTNETSVDSGEEMSSEKGKSILVAFYNVENLFDTEDEPEKEDGDFLPGGKYQWTNEVYLQKLDNLAAAIHSMGKNGPDILGITEVENAMVMKDLVQMTELKGRGYEIVHEESEDMRGIDVGFIYDPGIFQYKSHIAYDIDFPLEPDYTSRAVLVVNGKVGKEDISVIVNHWPSRYGGAEESEERRLVLARKVREITTEILAKNPDNGILVMGDFNDDPNNRSLAEVMDATTVKDDLGSREFYNPVGALHRPDDRGTLTYRGKWNLFDQILISKNLLDDGKGKLEYIEHTAGIHAPEFMQVGGDGPAKDMPRRAIYRDEFQKNGFSDHFPVYVRLKR